MIELAQTGYTWESITDNKNVDIQGLTSLVIYNRGEVPFKICGQIIAQGEQYRFLSDGTTSNFKEQLDFIQGVAGTRLAVLEKKWIVNNTPPGGGTPSYPIDFFSPSFKYAVHKLSENVVIGDEDLNFYFESDTDKSFYIKIKNPTPGAEYLLDVNKIDHPIAGVEQVKFLPIYDNKIRIYLNSKIAEQPIVFYDNGYHVFLQELGVFNFKVEKANNPYASKTKQYHIFEK